MQGQGEAALAHTSQAIAQLESLWGEFWVWEMPDIFLGHAETLAASGDAAGARAYIVRAHDTLMHFASQIRDPSVRHSSLRHYARVIAARETGQIPPLWP
jgi:hypothetical protein